MTKTPALSDKKQHRQPKLNNLKQSNTRTMTEKHTRELLMKRNPTNRKHNTKETKH